MGERPDTVTVLAVDAAAAAADGARPDLARRLTIAAERAARPTTVVAVAGEFKQGKSSLVNGLLGAEVCPVGHDLGTAVVTVVRHGPGPTARVRKTGGGMERVDMATLAEHITEAGNLGNHRGIEAVEVTGPFPLLPPGMVLVDTPGLGGLQAGQAAATLAFLAHADALLFVSDASAELSGHELDLLVEATASCPTIFLCLTKVDLYPHWRVVAERNRAHLTSRHIGVRTLPVAQPVRRAALVRADIELDRHSGFPTLVEALATEVCDPARVNAGKRTLTEVRSALVDLIALEEAEAAIAAGGGELAIAEARRQLAWLRGPGSQWRLLLHERLTALAGRVERDLRSRLRRLAADTDRGLDNADSPAAWDELAVSLSQCVAQAVAELLAVVELEASAVAADVVALLRDRQAALPTTWIDTIEFELTGDPRPVPSLRQGSTRHVLRHGQLLAHGATAGTDVLGLLSRLLPAGAGALLTANPVLLGAGLVLGGRAVAGGRRQQLEARREAARSASRAFLDDAGFQLGSHLAEVVAAVQERLRDVLGARISELEENCRELVDLAESAQIADPARFAAGRASLARLEALQARVIRLGAAS